MSFIRLQNIHKTYGKPPNLFEALRGISLEIVEGDFVALMGPSGSGKSTLANILGCLDSPSSGIYEFCGVNVCDLNLKQKALLRRHYIGFIFQGFNLLPRTTALENVELPLLYRQVPKKERIRQSMQALEMVGLEKWYNHQSNALSGGQQQRVAIARAIASNPLFLLADEPTGNLDTKRSIEIMEILARLNADSKITILMVTHEPEMARYATREIMFLDGLVQSDSANTQPQSIRDAAPPIEQSEISQNIESSSVQAQYNQE
ncbi:ABC transporter ATP-binding protein [Helicobacter sp. UBA3407]|nr:ABC transporter ATP-binding protein [Helicobacter sp. UBA3407]